MSNKSKGKELLKGKRIYGTEAHDAGHKNRLIRIQGTKESKAYTYKQWNKYFFHNADYSYRNSIIKFDATVSVRDANELINKMLDKPDEKPGQKGNYDLHAKVGGGFTPLFSNMMQDNIPQGFVFNFLGINIDLKFDEHGEAGKKNIEIRYIKNEALANENSQQIVLNLHIQTEDNCSADKALVAIKEHLQEFKKFADSDRKKIEGLNLEKFENHKDKHDGFKIAIESVSHDGVSIFDNYKSAEKIRTLLYDAHLLLSGEKFDKSIIYLDQANKICEANKDQDDWFTRTLDTIGLQKKSYLILQTEINNINELITQAKRLYNDNNNPHGAINALVNAKEKILSGQAKEMFQLKSQTIDSFIARYQKELENLQKKEEKIRAKAQLPKSSVGAAGGLANLLSKSMSSVALTVSQKTLLATEKQKIKDFCKESCIQKSLQPFLYGATSFLAKLNSNNSVGELNSFLEKAGKQLSDNYAGDPDANNLKEFLMASNQRLLEQNSTVSSPTTAPSLNS